MDLVVKNIELDIEGLSDLGERWRLEGFDPFTPS